MSGISYRMSLGRMLLILRLSPFSWKHVWGAEGSGGATTATAPCFASCCASTSWACKAARYAQPTGLLGTELVGGVELAAGGQNCQPSQSSVILQIEYGCGSVFVICFMVGGPLLERLRIKCAWITGGLCQKVSSAVSAAVCVTVIFAQSQPLQSLACVCMPAKPSRQQKVTPVAEVLWTYGIHFINLQANPQKTQSD